MVSPHVQTTQPLKRHSDWRNFCMPERALCEGRHGCPACMPTHRSTWSTSCVVCFPVTSHWQLSQCTSGCCRCSWLLSTCRCCCWSFLAVQYLRCWSFSLLLPWACPSTLVSSLTCLFPHIELTYIHCSFRDDTYRVSQEKNGVENYSILQMVLRAIYHCNILRHGNYNFYLDMCKVSNQYVKDN